LLRAGRGINIPLILTGPGGTAAPGILRQAEALGLSGLVRWLGVVPIDELVTYYRLATAVVFPSLHEGFGLPVLEAMACGTPVSCSATTSVGEVAGGAADTFDPDDPTAIAAAVARLLEDGGLRAASVEKGLRRAAEFTWERTAAQTWAAYTSILNAY
jgi:alpha-1,3-rhamnosyl/mannosyltransferase